MNHPRIDASRIAIRRGEAADAAAIAAFGARTFLETFGPANDPAHIRAYLDEAFGLAQQSAELADPDTTILLATFDDVLVAYAQLRRGPLPECVAHADAIELQRFYLDRHAHVGTSVLEEGQSCAFLGTEGHAHRCTNLSARRAAVTLHVYGGMLERYRNFDLRRDGRCVVSPTLAQVDGSLGPARLHG